MTILDQPVLVEDAPIKGKWTWFEKILPGIIIIVTVVREIIGWVWGYEVILTLGILLGFSYLFAFYWIAKPAIRSWRTVLVTILYGIAFFFGVFAFLFAILFLSGAKEMSVVAAVAILSAIIIDVVTAYGKNPVADSRMLIRIGILGVIVLVLYLIPESRLVQFTYRKYPEFVNYYKEHQADGRFEDIWNEYFRTHSIPYGEPK
jgi:hypothetical protein